MEKDLEDIKTSLFSDKEDKKSMSDILNLKKIFNSKKILEEKKHDRS